MFSGEVTVFLGKWKLFALDVNTTALAPGCPSATNVHACSHTHTCTHSHNVKTARTQRVGVLLLLCIYFCFFPLSIVFTHAGLQVRHTIYYAYYQKYISKVFKWTLFSSLTSCFTCNNAWNPELAELGEKILFHLTHIEENIAKLLLLRVSFSSVGRATSPFPPHFLSLCPVNKRHKSPRIYIKTKIWLHYMHLVDWLWCHDAMPAVRLK